jgi:Tfp pilus assembly protein PilN
VEVRKDLPIDWPKFILLGIISFTIIFLLVFIIFIYSLKMEISKLETELIQIQPKTVYALELKREIDQISKQVEILESLDEKQSFWHQLLWDINSRIPHELWLVNFSAGSDKILTINGQSMDLNSIGLFLNQLDQSPFLTETQLLEVETLSIEKQTVYNFELQTRLCKGCGK